MPQVLISRRRRIAASAAGKPRAVNLPEKTTVMSIVLKVRRIEESSGVQPQQLWRACRCRSTGDRSRGHPCSEGSEHLPPDNNKSSHRSPCNFVQLRELASTQISSMAFSNILRGKNSQEARDALEARAARQQKTRRRYLFLRSERSFSRRNFISILPLRSTIAQRSSATTPCRPI